MRGRLQCSEAVLAVPWHHAASTQGAMRLVLELTGSSFVLKGQKNVPV